MSQVQEQSLSLPERLIWSAVGRVLRALQKLPREQWIEVRRAVRTIVATEDASAAQSGIGRLIAALEHSGLIEPAEE